MPIYEYKCESCGKHFDFLAKRLTHTPDACPECGGKSLKKQLSTFSAKVASGASAPACPTGTCCPTGSCCPTGTCPLG